VENYITSTFLVETEFRPMEEGGTEYELASAGLTVLAQNNQKLAEKLSIATPAPIIDGRPRMLHTTAFIAHEGINKNGTEFIAQELRDATLAGKLFDAGYGGIIDIDHDFTPRGYWYKAETMINPETQTTGILAHGAVWAYLFPEDTDRILAEQQREGKVKFSMVCMAKSEDVESRRTDEGALVQTMHNPVFLGATILLDKPAGDAHAIGKVAEDPNATSERDRRNALLQAASGATNDNNNLEEQAMIDEIRPLLAELLGDQSEKFIDSISELIAAKAGEFSTILDEKDATILEASNKNEELTSQVETLTTQSAEKDLAIESLQSDKETLTTELAETKASLAEFVQAQEDARVEALKNSRLAELSPVVTERLMAKSEEVRDKIIEKWANQSDEEWEATKAELSLTADPVVALPNPAPNINADGKKSIRDFLKK